MSIKILTRLAVGNANTLVLIDAASYGHWGGRKVLSRIRNLERLGLVAEVLPRTSISQTFAITDAGHAVIASGIPTMPNWCHRQNSMNRTLGLTERVWWHLRMFTVATTVELLDAHALRQHGKAYGQLNKYLSALENVGILQRAARTPSNEDGRLSRWMLVKDLGPSAPILHVRRKVGYVYDPNHENVYPILVPINDAREII